MRALGPAGAAISHGAQRFFALLARVATRQHCPEPMRIEWMRASSGRLARKRRIMAASGSDGGRKVAVTLQPSAATRADVDVFAGQALQQDVVGLARLVRRYRRQAEECFGAIEFGRAVSAGEQSVVADTGEARRQDVQCEPPDEFVGVQRHRFGLGAVFVVFPGEGDVAVGKIQDAVVADGDAVGVST